MENKELIEKFYTSFANRDAKGMISCYHEDICFEDPAFGKLYGDDAKAMWQMLLSRNSGLKISFNTIETSEKKGAANWVAEYIFVQTGRNVINRVAAQFEFSEGKIIKHTDYFDFWNESIHNITEDDIIDSPKFPEIYDDTKTEFEMMDKTPYIRI